MLLKNICDFMGKIQFDPEGFGIVIFVSLKNKDIKRRIRMVLDTGSTYNMIPWHIAEELGYRPAMSNEYVPINTANGQVHVPKINMSLTSAIGKSVKGCTTLIHDLPETSRVDGLLGLSFLKKYKVVIDFKKGILEIT